MSLAIALVVDATLLTFDKTLDTIASQVRPDA